MILIYGKATTNNFDRIWSLKRDEILGELCAKPKIACKHKLRYKFRFGITIILVGRKSCFKVSSCVAY